MAANTLRPRLIGRFLVTSPPHGKPRLAARGRRRHSDLIPPRGKIEDTMKVSVILPAAGLGTRMVRPSGLLEKSGRKQFLMLDGTPVLIHTIRKFLQCPSVSEIIVALREEDITWVQELIDKLNPSKPIHLTEGGDSRQQSVKNAMALLSPDTELVAVHDAVRPFVEPELVETVIAEAARTGAAIVGIVPVDTVKQVHKHTVRATLPREHLILTQTPQVFSVALLREAFERGAYGGHGDDVHVVYTRVYTHDAVTAEATRVQI